jgi:hypothetical protein
MLVGLLVILALVAIEAAFQAQISVEAGELTPPAVQTSTATATGGGATATGGAIYLSLNHPVAPYPPREATRSSEPERKSNLVFTRSETVSLVYSATDRDKVKWSKASKRADNALSVIACFRNEPGERVINVNNVRAQIVYQNECGDEIGEVGRAAWLETDMDLVDFPAGETRCLILIVRCEGQLSVPFVKREPAGYMAETVKSDLLNLESQPARIEVNLLSGKTGERKVGPVSFDFSVDLNGDPQVKLRR